jgi:phosphoribosyl 1,2-cyclic phosphodiesterase
MTIGITALGSGSRGNAFVIHSPDADILIDAGFSRKDILERMASVGVNPAKIKALLLTHEHEDHVRGGKLFCNQFDIPAYATMRTMNYLEKKATLPNRVLVFEPGEFFEIAGFRILPFAVQHDAIDPVGFVITKGGRSIALATDLGVVNSLARQRLYNCDILVLESNYDQDMLRNSQRQLYLKRRIMGRNGHLNNEDTINSLPELLSERTSALFLVHVSSECNTYELVRELARRKLHEMQRQDIFLQIVEQSVPVSTYWLESADSLEI